MIEAPTPSLRTGVRGAPGWLRLFRTRLREAAFWKIQAAVMSITVAHLLIERYDVWTEIGLHHLTVTLYLIPVVYAGLRYGLEGGLLTGAWAIVLTLPNIFIWHPSPIVWSGELLRVFVVTGVGMAVSVPVERERRQSDRLLDTSRRLALLNSVSSSLVSSARPEVIVPRVLERLREVLGLAGVGVASWQLGDESPAREEWVQADPDGAERLRSLLAEEGPVGTESGEGER
ncbi:MAG: hypothetical protein HY658_06440, partial [Actinobacteria bacterium]|nr:hypothetical protein [Actinomycetota bacterium]